MNRIIKRYLDDSKCTLGTLDLDGLVLQTLERPWVPGAKGGIPGRSCIPAGTYQLVLHDSEAHPKSFAMVNEALGVYHLNVPNGEEGRTACLIHPANYAQELRGCIALGTRRERYGATWCIRESRKANDLFCSLVSWVEGHTLTIEDLK